MLISVHYLLHVADSIIATGPCWSTWQYPMERLIGLLLPLVRSRSNPYKNLTNNIILHERFNHLKYISKTLFDIYENNKSTKNYSEEMVCVSSDSNEEFWWPSQKYNLTKTEIKKIKECYVTMYDVLDISLIKVLL